VATLLLAAAEQREQLDAAQSKLAEWHAKMLTEVPVTRTQQEAYEQQIATLTAENETLRHQWETTRATLIDVQTYAQKQLATLTAELEAVKAERTSLKSLTLKEERDEARATLAKMRAALVGLVGASESEELRAMEVFVRASPVPAEDKAASIDAIHALLYAPTKPA